MSGIHSRLWTIDTVVYCRSCRINRRAHQIWYPSMVCDRCWNPDPGPPFNLEDDMRSEALEMGELERKFR